MLHPLALLNHRLELLEKTYIGSSSSGNDLNEDDFLSRINTLGTKFQSLQNDVPAFKSCFELSEKLKPLLNEKKGSAVLISQKLDSLLANKAAIEQNFRRFHTVGELSTIIDGFNENEISELTARLQALDKLLQPLSAEVKAQNQEIDELLNLYEQAMTVMSDLCCSWESQLKQIEVTQKEDVI